MPRETKPTTATPLRFSDIFGKTSTAFGSAKACLFAALATAPSSILLLILSSNLLSHDSVTWLAICIFTWMLSIVTWLFVTSIIVGIDENRYAGSRALYSVFYFLGLGIASSFTAARLRIIGIKSFDGGLFPLEEIDWSLTVCMLLGTVVSWGSSLVAHKVAERVDSDGHTTRQYGGCC